jgi:iron complex transport system substrate-binding protein
VIKTQVIVLIVLLSVVLAGCGTPEPAATSIPATAPPERTSAPVSAFPITIVDGVGNEVTLESEPERIVSLAPGHTETLYALGLGQRVVGVTAYCNYPAEAAEKTQVGDFAGIDLELVVGLDPDLVLASTLQMGDVVPALQEHGIVVVVATPESVLEVLTTIDLIGQITGRQAVAQALVAQLRGRIEAVEEAIREAPRLSVFWELGAELYTVGPGSFVDDLITLAGGQNVAADADSPWPQLSVETIILKDPQVIVLADHNYGETAEMLKERPGWAEISAVKEGRVIEITNDDIVSRPGPRIVEGLEFLARALHPDRFE